MSQERFSLLGRAVRVLALLACVAFASLNPVSRAVAAGSAQETARPVVITSERMEADNRSGRVVFTGDVVAVEDFTLCSDRLSIGYAPDRSVSVMEADGRVTILLEGKSASADHALYDKTRRTLVLSGDARVSKCADTVKGSKIRINLDDGNAVVEGGGGPGKRVRAVIMPEKKCDRPAPAGEDANLEETRCRRAEQVLRQEKGR